MKRTSQRNLYTFWRTLRRAAPLGLLPAAWLGGLFGAAFAQQLRDIADTESLALQFPEQWGNALRLRDAIYYFFLPEQSEGTVRMLSIGLALLCALAGISLFRFIASKKSVNVYYSLGLSRQSLFLQTAAAGAVVLTAGIGLGVAVPVLMNCIAFGATAQLWQMALYLFASFSVMGITAFGVAAAIFSLVGTVAEGTAFSLAVLGTPAVLFLLCEQMMNRFVFGSPYAVGFFSAGEYHTYTLPRLSNLLCRFDPTGFNLMTFTEKSELRWFPEDGSLQWSAPSFSPVFLWAGIALAVLALGTLLFARRRAELSGFPGVSRAGNTLTATLVGLCAFGFCTTLSASEERLVLCVAIGFAAYALSYAAVEIFAHRSVKTFLRRIYKLPLHLGFAALVLVIFKGGLLGYTARVPQAQDIESVSISDVMCSPVANQYVLYRGMRADPAAIGLVTEKSLFRALQMGVNDELSARRTEKDTIEAVRALHQKIAETGAKAVEPTYRSAQDAASGVQLNLTIEYRLKNGKTILRHFATSSKEILQEAALLQSRHFTLPAIGALFAPPPISEEAAKENLEFARLRMRTETSAFLAPGSQIAAAAALELSAAQMNGLLDALQADFAALPPQELLYPQPPLATLMLQVSEQGGLFGESIDYNSSAVYSCLDPTNGQIASIPLTAQMPKALAFLRANGAADILDSRADFQSVRLCPAEFALHSFRRFTNTYHLGTLHFVGLWQKYARELGQSDQSGGFYGSAAPAVKLPADSREITAPALVAQLQDTARLSYYIAEPGYYALFLDQDGGETILFIPAKDLPDSLK